MEPDDLESRDGSSFRDRGRRRGGGLRPVSLPHGRRANDGPGDAFPSVMSDRDAIWRFAEHVAGTDYEDLPQSATVATRTFLLDTLGVGVAGSAGPWTRCLIETQRLSCPGDHARVWSHGARLSAAGAAVCNAYQLHNAEFDCVHEGGVGGRDFLTALALGVDVACHLGVASTSPLRFFRPPQPGRSVRPRPSAASPGSTPGPSSTPLEPSSASSREPCRPTSRARPCSGCRWDSTHATRSSPATWRRAASPRRSRCVRAPSDSFPCSRASMPSGRCSASSARPRG